MEQNMLHRIAFIDVAKAICIFLMVVGHWTNNDMLFTYIYSFHMPALFIISGYLFRSRSWLKTVLGFAIPVATFSMFNLLVKLFVGEINIEDITLIFIFLGTFHYRYGLGDGLFMGDWFLWALIGLRLLFGDVEKLSFVKKYYIPLAGFCLIYMTLEFMLFEINSLFRGYYIGLMIPSLPFFCVGLYLKNINWNPKIISNLSLFFLLVSFIVIPILNGRCCMNDHLYGRSYIIFFLNAVLSSILLFYLSDKIATSKIIERISKGTLVILGTHMPILQILGYLLPPQISITFPFLTMAICYCIILLCERHFPILLGKMKS